MSDSPLPEESADDLQFTTAELGITPSPGTAPARNCALCRQPIASIYYAVRDKLLCPSCCERLNAPPPGSGFGRLLKAFFMGLGAGLAGAVLWYIVRRVTGYEVGLIAVVVGFMVGKAVRNGSANCGGLGYQILAVVLTYCCITANYLPDALEAGFRRQREAILSKAIADANAKPGPAKNNIANDLGAGAAKNPNPQAERPKRIHSDAVVVILAIAVSLALPFWLLPEHIIGLLIIGFALWEAWKFTARRPIPISGPYQMGPAPAA